MKKPHKSAGKHPLIHPSFPPQGQEQPAHMGSQSMTPNLDMQLAGPQAPSMPIDSATSMSPSGEF